MASVRLFVSSAQYQLLILSHYIGKTAHWAVENGDFSHCFRCLSPETFRIKVDIVIKYYLVPTTGFPLTPKTDNLE